MEFKNLKEMIDINAGKYYPGAGDISCVEGYIELADALANGGLSPKTGERILTQRTIDIMRTNNLKDGRYGNYWLHDNSYGLGVHTLVTNVKELCQIQVNLDGAVRQEAYSLQTPRSNCQYLWQGTSVHHTIRKHLQQL